MSDEKYPSQLAERFQIRMPDGLRDRIRESAEAHSRSMNAEILSRLEAGFEITPRLRRELEMKDQIIANLELQIEKLRELDQVRAESIAALSAANERLVDNISRSRAIYHHGAETVAGSLELLLKTAQIMRQFSDMALEQREALPAELIEAANRMKHMADETIEAAGDVLAMRAKQSE